MRLTPIGNIVRALNFAASESTPLIAPGTTIRAVGSQPVNTGTNVPNWGMSDLLYASNASTAVPRGSLVTIDKNFRITAAASTANLGIPLFVALTDFAVGSTTEQYGWIMRSGIAPVTFSVAATAGALYLGTAGNATPTAAAGKQILGAQTIIAAASAFTRSIVTLNGSKNVRIAADDGLFIGQTVTGTGVPGSTTVADIDPSGTSFTMSNAATASGSVTGTFTPTGYGIVLFNHPHSQGQIT